MTEPTASASASVPLEADTQPQAASEPCPEDLLIESELQSPPVATPAVPTITEQQCQNATLQTIQPVPEASPEAHHHHHQQRTTTCSNDAPPAQQVQAIESTADSNESSGEAATVAIVSQHGHDAKPTKPDSPPLRLPTTPSIANGTVDPRADSTSDSGAKHRHGHASAAHKKHSSSKEHECKHSISSSSKHEHRRSSELPAPHDSSSVALDPSSSSSCCPSEPTPGTVENRLFVFVHGNNGAPTDWTAIEAAIKKRLPHAHFVCCSTQ
jgi:hypothetical protein